MVLYNVKKWVEPLNFIEIQFSHDFIVMELDIQKLRVTMTHVIL